MTSYQERESKINQKFESGKLPKFNKENHVNVYVRKLNDFFFLFQTEIMIRN